MKICLDRNIGGEKYLLIEKDSITALQQNPITDNADVVFYGTRQFDYLINTFLKEEEVRTFRFPSEKYIKGFNGIIDDPNKVLWYLALPSHIYNKEIESFSAKVQAFLNQVNEDYFNAQREISFFLSQLKPAYIDTDKFEECFFDESNLGQRATLNTFRPSSKGFAPKVLYTNASTKTGRLRTVFGPDILHLRKDLRSIISSRHGDDGSIIYLDYKSLEPRTLLAINCMKKGVVKDISGDVYSHFLNELNLELPREAVKISLLSNLYGQSKDKTAQTIKKWVSDPQGFLDEIDHFFQIAKTKEFLKDEYENNNCGFIRNFFGRPLYSETSFTLLNYYIQSTAADVALMGFSNIFNKIKDIKMLDVFTPLFILHDAMIIDMHNDVERHLQKICKLGEKIKGFEKFKFDLECSKI